MAQVWIPTENDGFFDPEQINKRLEWLDNERRKDKNQITILAEQISALQSENIQLKSQIKDFQNEIARYSNIFPRIDQIESALSQLRVDAFRTIEEKDKVRSEKEKEIDLARRNGVDSLNRAIAEIRKVTEPIQDIRKTIQARVDEEFRLARLIEEVGNRIDAISQDREDFIRFQKAVEESRRQDMKRVTDVQNEMSAYRKRIEDMRGRVDLVNDSLHKIEQRINDLATSEAERKQTISTFQEKQNMINLEFSKTWQEWKTTFDEIILKAANLDTQMQALENTHRSVKRSQDSLDEVTQRFDRRTNELIEMQRLTEEKLRQEWAAYKNDDQKRWTNYSLGQDEIQSDYQRSIQALQARMQAIEDSAASAMDEVSLHDELYVAQLQDLFTMVRGWLKKWVKHKSTILYININNLQISKSGVL
jgi:chromosome segregation ATPase